MTRSEKYEAAQSSAAWFAVFVMGIGWIMNVFKLVSSDSEMIGMLLARFAGIFLPPLGGILGWM